MGLQPGHVRGHISGAGHHPKAILGQAGHRHVGDHPATLVAPLGVSHAPDRPLDVVCADPLQQAKRARTVNGDLPERAQVDDPGTLPNRASLGRHPFEPGWLGPAVGRLVAPGTLPRPTGLENVGPLPAGLGPKDRAGLLEPAMQRREAARTARQIGIVRVAQPVIVPVGLACQPGREARVSIDVAEPPGALGPDIHTRVAGGDPAGQRPADPPTGPEAVE